MESARIVLNSEKPIDDNLVKSRHPGESRGPGQ
jgi:hypothetical protein